jgi:hypothetical protein
MESLRLSREVLRHRRVNNRWASSRQANNRRVNNRRVRLKLALPELALPLLELLKRVRLRLVNRLDSRLRALLRLARLSKLKANKLRDRQARPKQVNRPAPRRLRLRAKLPRLRTRRLWEVDGNAAVTRLERLMISLLDVSYLVNIYVGWKVWKWRIGKWNGKICMSGIFFCFFSLVE